MYEVNGDSLKRYRESKQLSQSELGDIAQLTPSTISRLELGRKFAKGSTVTKLAEALNVDAAELIVVRPRRDNG